MIGRLAHLALVALLAQPLQPDQPAQPDNPTNLFSPSVPISTSSWPACWRGATTTGASCSSTCWTSESRPNCWGRAACACTASSASTPGTSAMACSSGVQSGSTASRLSEDERRKYEDEWLAREKARDEKREKQERRIGRASDGPCRRQRADAAGQGTPVRVGRLLPQVQVRAGPLCVCGPRDLRRPAGAQDRVLPGQALRRRQARPARRRRRGRKTRATPRAAVQQGRAGHAVDRAGLAPDRQVRLREHRHGLPAWPLDGPRRRRGGDDGDEPAVSWRVAADGTSTATAGSRSPTAPTTSATSSTTATIERPPPRRPFDDRAGRPGSRPRASPSHQAPARRRADRRRPRARQPHDAGRGGAAPGRCRARAAVLRGHARPHAQGARRQRAIPERRRAQAVRVAHAT